MSSRFLRALVCLLLVLGAGPAGAQESTVRLTSLDWPPFSGAELPGQGASIVVASAAFSAAGQSLAVEFYPWQRTVHTGLTAPGYVGYFPEYYAHDLEESCLFSDPIGSTPLGFVERRSDPIAWSSLDDLASLRIGTVRGYVNTEAFDRRAAEGDLTIDPVVNDTLNILKVAAGRIDLAVIDRNVLAYLLQHDPKLAGLADKVQFNARPLEDKKLYVCFRKSEEGEQARVLFNRALEAIDIDSLMAQALAPQS